MSLSLCRFLLFLEICLLTGTARVLYLSNLHAEDFKDLLKYLLVCNSRFKSSGAVFSVDKIPIFQSNPISLIILLFGL